jgi:hypothetical protein
MKKVITLLAAVAVMSSCVTGTKLATSNAPADSKTYTVLPEDKTATARNRIWILFIPITIGPKSEEKREARCLNRMLNQNKADGIVTGKYTHRKFVVPLILVTYSHRNTILTATPFKLNADSLKK